MSDAFGRIERVSTDDELRDWAKGMTGLEAATEMLIRGGYAQEWRPWVRYDEQRGRHWIDFDSIPEQAGGMSGGEQRFLRVAASLGSDSPIILGDEVTGTDRRHVQLILAAIAHAAGVGTPGHDVEHDDNGVAHIVTAPALYTWPEH
jgi:hypothetical protein